MPQRIGFIGLGNMGKPMATRLIDAGFPVTVWNRTRSKSQELAERGALVAGSPRELATTSDVIMTMIWDDDALEAVAFGEEGILAGLAKGSILVEMSTVSPESSRRLARAAEERGATMLRVPVSGSTPQAQAGNLVLYISGDRRDYERCQDILSTLGHKVIYAGGEEEARYLKLVVNTMVGINNHMLAEAVAFGEKAGLQWDVLLEALTNTVVTSPFMTFKLGLLTDMMTKGEYKVTATPALIEKDLDIALSQARRLEVPMPVTALVRQFLGMLEATGRGELDYVTLLFLMEELAGIKR